MKTFFRSEMTIPGFPEPGPRKAIDLMDLVRPDPDDVVSDFPAATVAQLSRAHSFQFTFDVLTGHAPTGYAEVSTEVAAQAAWCSGAMIAATEEAIRERSIVCVPASGFHHAEYGRAKMYCTFNGLMVAIRNNPAAKRVLIIDGDAHYGDGTEDIIRKLRLSRAVTNIDTRSKTELHLFLCEPWDLILYQAGADAHQDDPYGTGYLTDEEWLWRDMTIFKTAAQRHVPLVWCLAGGYNGDRTTTLHARTFKTAKKVSDAAAAAVLESSRKVVYGLPVEGS